MGPRAPKTDAELITLARDGDATGITELYARYRPPLLRIAQRITRNPADAEDAVSEAFTGLLSALRGGKGPNEYVLGYLSQSVRRAALVAMRRRGRVDELKVDPDSGERLAAQLAEGVTLKQAFSRLPERSREVLWLTEVEGLSRHEVAALMSTTPAAVAMAASRARDALREAYLAAHLPASTKSDCEHTLAVLPAAVRGRSSLRISRLMQHLGECGTCSRAAADLRALNEHLGSVVAYLSLGAGVGVAAASTPFAPAASAGALAPPAAQAMMRSWPWARRLFSQVAAGGAHSALAAAAVLAAAVAGGAIYLVPAATSGAAAAATGMPTPAPSSPAPSSSPSASASSPAEAAAPPTAPVSPSRAVPYDSPQPSTAPPSSAPSSAPSFTPSLPSPRPTPATPSAPSPRTTPAPSASPSPSSPVASPSPAKVLGVITAIRRPGELLPIHLMVQVATTRTGTQLQLTVPGLVAYREHGPLRCSAADHARLTCVIATPTAQEVAVDVLYRGQPTAVVSVGSERRELLLPQLLK